MVVSFMVVVAGPATIPLLLGRLGQPVVLLGQDMGHTDSLPQVGNILTIEMGLSSLRWDCIQPLVKCYFLVEACTLGLAQCPHRPTMVHNSKGRPTTLSALLPTLANQRAIYYKYSKIGLITGHLATLLCCVSPFAWAQPIGPFPGCP